MTAAYIGNGLHLSLLLNMTVHIKLYGEKGERFEEIKASMTNEWGYEPTNPEVIGRLMASYEQPLTSQGR